MYIVRWCCWKKRYHMLCLFKWYLLQDFFVLSRRRCITESCPCLSLEQMASTFTTEATCERFYRIRLLQKNIMQNYFYSLSSPFYAKKIFYIYSSSSALQIPRLYYTYIPTTCSALSFPRCVPFLYICYLPRRRRRSFWVANICSRRTSCKLPRQIPRWFGWEEDRETLCKLCGPQRQPCTLLLSALSPSPKF
uniref:PD205R n=1 Tax=African swine fever virus TaxID=10497 RepID=A0A6G7KTS9_ASF